MKKLNSNLKKLIIIEIVILISIIITILQVYGFVNTVKDLKNTTFSSSTSNSDTIEDIHKVSVDYINDYSLYYYSWLLRNDFNERTSVAEILNTFDASIDFDLENRIVICKDRVSKTYDVDKKYLRNTVYYNNKRYVVSEITILNDICKLFDEYPSNSDWSTEKSWYSEEFESDVTACMAWVDYCYQNSFYKYGMFPKIYTDYTVNSIRVGDGIIYTNSDGTNHIVLVMENEGDYLIVSEGNLGGKISWNRRISFTDLNSSFYGLVSCWEEE